MRKKCFALAFTLSLAACNTGNDLGAFSGLEQRVSTYYSLEQRGDWREAYEFRTPAFRQSVSRELYVSQMEKDNAGWRLEKYKIDSISTRNDKVYLSVTFTEIPPSGHMKGRVPPGREPSIVVVEDESIWLNSGGVWYAYSPATRGRLSLNHAVVP